MLKKGIFKKQSDGQNGGQKKKAPNRYWLSALFYW